MNTSKLLRVSVARCLLLTATILSGCVAPPPGHLNTQTKKPAWVPPSGPVIQIEGPITMYMCDRLMVVVLKTMPGDEYSKTAEGDEYWITTAPDVVLDLPKEDMPNGMIQWNFKGRYQAKGYVGENATTVLFQKMPILKELGPDFLPTPTCRIFIATYITKK